MAETPQVISDNPKTAYEREDWPLGPIGLIYLAIFIFLAIAPLAIMWGYPNSLADVSRRLLVRPPAPDLQVEPARDLAKFRAEETKRLDTYYWIDKENGIVHIPIEQAMKKLAATGIAGFPKSPP